MTHLSGTLNDPAVPGSIPSVFMDYEYASSLRLDLIRYCDRAATSISVVTYLAITLVLETSRDAGPPERTFSSKSSFDEPSDGTSLLEHNLLLHKRVNSTTLLVQAIAHV